MFGSSKKSSGLLVVAMIAALGAGLNAAAQMNPLQRTKPRKTGRRATPRSRKSTLHTTNGARECARRLRQIEAGTLQVSQ